MFYTTIRVETKEVEFETPENLTDGVQEASEAKRIGKLRKAKKQVYKKYKHRSEFTEMHKFGWFKILILMFLKLFIYQKITIHKNVTYSLMMRLVK